MNTQPTRGGTVRELAEAEALAYAKRELSHFSKAGSSPYSEDPLLSPAASHAFVRQRFRDVMLDDALTMFRMTLIDWARAGEPVIHEMLVHLILELKSRGNKLPTELAAYDMEITRDSLTGRRNAPARKKMSYFLRDLQIARVVAAIQDRFGIEPTGSSKVRRSGCSLAAAALTDVHTPIGEAGVVAIWKNYKTAMPTVPGWSHDF